jgi:sirohydrochlorin ferrochelatase
VDVSLGKETPLARLFPRGIKVTRVLLILRRGISALAVGLVIGSFGTSTFADDLYGRIRGVVSDSSGGTVAGVQVTATNVDTGIAKTVTSGADGSYEFLQLAAPGNYSVQAEQKGFKTYRVGAIHLKLNQIYVLNVALELGAVTESVIVQAGQTQVEATSIQLGRDIGADTVVDLPLNGRNWV